NQWAWTVDVRAADGMKFASATTEVSTAKYDLTAGVMNTRIGTTVHHVGEYSLQAELDAHIASRKDMLTFSKEGITVLSRENILIACLADVDAEEWATAVGKTEILAKNVKIVGQNDVWLHSGSTMKLSTKDGPTVDLDTQNVEIQTPKGGQTTIKGPL